MNILSLSLARIDRMAAINVFFSIPHLVNIQTKTLTQPNMPSDLAIAQEFRTQHSHTHTQQLWCIVQMVNTR